MKASKKEVIWEKIPLNPVLRTEVAKDLRHRLAEAQVRLPATTLDSFSAWAIEYYLQHAYKEPDPFEEEIRDRIADERMEYEDDPGLYEHLQIENFPIKKGHVLKLVENVLSAYYTATEQVIDGDENTPIDDLVKAVDQQDVAESQLHVLGEVLSLPEHMVQQVVSAIQRRYQTEHTHEQVRIHYLAILNYIAIGQVPVSVEFDEKKEGEQHADTESSKG